MSGWAGVIGVVSSIFSAMEKPCWDKTGNAKAELGAYLMGSAKQRYGFEMSRTAKEEQRCEWLRQSRAQTGLA